MAEQLKTEITRLAPTPSGFLHFGNVLSFVITTSIARTHHALLLLRIDDLDRERFRSEYLEDIFDTLDFLGIQPDIGPSGPEEFETSFSQRHRIHLYTGLLQKLRTDQAVYACNCSRRVFENFGNAPCNCLGTRLNFDTPETVWRMVDLPEFKSFNDIDELNHLVKLRESPGQIPLKQRNGSPSYQIASLADDLHYGVNLVVRGADLIPSTAMQLHLAKVLGLADFEKTDFLHHGLLLENGLKMSKSAGASSIKYMREQGLTRSTIYQQLANLLGVKSMKINQFDDFFDALNERMVESIRTFLPIESNH